MVYEKKDFSQFPVSLKLTIIWVFLICMFRLFSGAVGLISTLSINITITDWVAGFVFLRLANGLIRGDNWSRLETMIWISLGSLIRIYLIAMAIINSDTTLVMRFLQYQTLIPELYGMTFLIVNVMINIGVLLVLWNFEIKNIFVSQVTPRDTT